MISPIVSCWVLSTETVILKPTVPASYVVTAMVGGSSMSCALILTAVPNRATVASAMTQALLQRHSLCNFFVWQSCHRGQTMAMCQDISSGNRIGAASDRMPQHLCGAVQVVKALCSCLDGAEQLSLCNDVIDGHENRFDFS